MSSPISVAVPPDWIRNGRPATIVSASRTTDSGTTAIEIGLGIEDHRPRHLRLDGYGAANAERRTEAHVADQFIRACRHQDLVDSAVADGGHELAHGAHRDLGELSTTLYRKGSCTGRGAAEHLCACTDAVRVMGRRSRGHRGRVDVAQPRTHKHSRTITHAQALTRTRTRKRIRKHMQTCTHTRARANPHTHTNRHRRARARTHLAVDSRWCLVTPALLPTSQLKRRSPQLSCRKGGNKSERFWARAGKE